MPTWEREKKKEEKDIIRKMQRISQTFVSLYFGNMNWETELSLPRERSGPQDLFAEFGSHEQVLGSILPSNVKGRGLPFPSLGLGVGGGG
jgi:hypothetical protein